MEEIASSEGRSTAQICEVFLSAGTDTYKKTENKVIINNIGKGTDWISWQALCLRGRTEVEGSALGTQSFRVPYERLENLHLTLSFTWRIQ